MKKAYITLKDEVYAFVSGLQPQDQEFLENKFAYMVEGAFFMPLYKLGRWDGKVRFFERTGKIFIRLLDEMLPYLDGWGYEIELRDERKPVNECKVRVTPDWFAKKENQKLKFDLRPYQVEAVNLALEHGGGIIEAATGAGKTWMVGALCDAFGQDDLRAIVIVPSVDLVDQTAATFRLGQIDVGTYGGKVKDLAHQHIISTWQSLQNNPKIIEDFDVLIVDECHGAKAKVIGEIVNNFGKNIHFRFGVTGTIPEPQVDRATIKGTLGEVIFSITAAELIEMGYLAQLEIEPIEIKEAVEEEFPDYSSEKTFLGRSPDRLDLIADLIITKAERFGNTLVLVNSVKQGQALQKRIQDSVFLYGTTETEVRAEWYSLFNDRDDLIVIATFGIASTGISIDRVFNLMLLDAGKSFIRSIQSIGRGLRKADDKDRVHCVDIHSNLKWSKKHYRMRAKFYKNAQYPLLKVVKMTV